MWGYRRGRSRGVAKKAAHRFTGFALANGDLVRRELAGPEEAIGDARSAGDHRAATCPNATCLFFSAQPMKPLSMRMMKKKWTYSEVP